MSGYELYEKIFAKQIEEYGEFDPYEIEDLEGVTCYDENLSYHDGWYIVTEISFRYEGKKYSFERQDHTSDNVSDTEYLMHTFKEVIPSNELEKAIDRIIKGIEDETVGSWKELVQQLEEVKTKFGRVVEY